MSHTVTDKNELLVIQV